MNLPGANVDLPTLTDKDIDDLEEFGLKQSVDMIAASFVRKASDVEYIREILGPKGADIKIISKINICFKHIFCVFWMLFICF